MIQSRGGKPLQRYFPELRFPPGRYIVDGEIVIDDPEGGQDFDALQNRIHPALHASTCSPSRRRRATSRSTCSPARTSRGWRSRSPSAGPSSRNSPATASTSRRLTGDPAEAEPWLRSGEGVVAKDTSAPYRPGERTGMFKIKRVRTIDAVVAGWRPGKEPDTVGSLILGLYDDGGELHIVGHSSGLKAAEKRALVGKLVAYETGKRGHGDPSRWKNEKELEWIDLRPELVVEVTFDHASGGRIRHGTKILRWREDKQPRECKLEQMSL